MSLPPASRFRRLLLGWVLSFGAFGLFAALIGAQSVIVGTHTLSEMLLIVARTWLPWAVMAPPLFMLVNLSPPEGPRRARALTLHALCGLTALCTAFVWSEFILRPRSGPRQEEVRRSPAPPDGECPPPAPPGKPPRVMPVILGTPILLAIFGLAYAGYFSRRAKERELKAAALREDMARAGLRALRMQLHPHFLFNSLNAIASLIHGAPDKADEMTVALAAFLRLTLDTTDEQEIPLRRELEFTDLYLRIEEIRFGDRLRIVHEIGNGTAGALVPAFLLQPLVENSVRHGLAPRAAVTVITIGAMRAGDRLVLRVADNGGGPVAETPMREGIGLSNTRARLEALYAGEATLAFRHDNGFVVEITLPFRPAA